MACKVDAGINSLPVSAASGQALCTERMLRVRGGTKVRLFPEGKMGAGAHLVDGESRCLHQRIDQFDSRAMFVILVARILPRRIAIPVFKDAQAGGWFAVNHVMRA